MESKEKSQYQVIITAPAESAFYQVVDYLYDQYSVTRAEELANHLRDTAKELYTLPGRGSLEPQLSGRVKKYRYILFKRSSRATIKIVYYVDESENVVYITDFFPTEMDDKRLIKRNK